jgi:hypothetical protein
MIDHLQIMSKSMGEICAAKDKGGALQGQSRFEAFEYRAHLALK